nr:hypothetical protein [Gammaproteobacteria bacterium]
NPEPVNPEPVNPDPKPQVKPRAPITEAESERAVSLLLQYSDVSKSVFLGLFVGAMVTAVVLSAGLASIPIGIGAGLAASSVTGLLAKNSFFTSSRSKEDPALPVTFAADSVI